MEEAVVVAQGADGNFPVIDLMAHIANGVQPGDKTDNPKKRQEQPA